MQVVSPPIEVPANSSRFFTDQQDALGQPVGTVELAWSQTQPYVFNHRFDADLIAHDESYCTSVVDINGVTQVPTTAYMLAQVLPRLTSAPNIVDIGCGQGEFVETLRREGLAASGYDPVLRRSAPYLHRRYWTPGESASADLFVMRCVLPHIEQPWDFLNTIAVSNPGAMVLVEFQRLEWIFGNAIWYQLSHDHVNVFSVADFAARYTVIDDGTFSNGEWAWVLIDPATVREVAEQPYAYAREMEHVFGVRAATLRRAAELDRPLAIWGAAGKGIVLADALSKAGVEDLAVIDADPNRWGRFIEPTGLQVRSPEQAGDTLSSETLILVCNPNHLGEIQRSVGHLWELAIPRDLAV